MSIITAGQHSRLGLLNLKTFFGHLESRLDNLQIRVGDFSPIDPQSAPLIQYTHVSKRRDAIGKIDLYVCRNTLWDLVRSCGLVLVTSSEGEEHCLGHIVAEYGAILDPHNGDESAMYTSARFLLPSLADVPRCCIKIWAQQGSVRSKDGELRSKICYERRDHRKLPGASIRRSFETEYPTAWFFDPGVTLDCLGL